MMYGGRAGPPNKLPKNMVYVRCAERKRKGPGTYQLIGGINVNTKMDGRIVITFRSPAHNTYSPHVVHDLVRSENYSKKKLISIPIRTSVHFRN